MGAIPGMIQDLLLGTKLLEENARYDVEKYLAVCGTFLKGKNGILAISIITQVIIEILAHSLAENGVIFRYNHLRRGDYSGRTNFQNSRLSLRQCV